MRRVLSFVESLTDRFGRILAYVVLVIVGVIAYEVISRFAFNNPTLWAHETAALVFGVYIILAGGYAVLHERHVRIDVLWARLSPRGRAIVDLVTAMLTFTFVCALVWYAIPYAWHSFQIRECAVTSFAPPLYPFKIAMVIGAVWLFLMLVVKLIRDIYAVTTGTQELGHNIKRS